MCRISGGESEWMVMGKRALMEANRSSKYSMPQVRVEAALHHDGGPAQIQGLLDFGEDLVLGEHVALGEPGGRWKAQKSHPVMQTLV